MYMSKKGVSYQKLFMTRVNQMIRQDPPHCSRLSVCRLPLPVVQSEALLMAVGSEILKQL